MASNHPTTKPDEKLYLHEASGAVFFPAAVVGAVGILLAVVFGLITPRDPGVGRFYHAYLVSLAFIMAISLGSLFLLLVMHLLKAGWNVTIRRILETNAAAIPYVGLLAIPILVSVLSQNASLYPWAVDLKSDEAKAYKAKSEHAFVVPADAPVAAAGSPLSTGTFIVSADPAHAASEAAGHAEGQSKDAAHDKGHGAHAPKPVGYHAKYGYKDFGDFTIAKQPWLNPYFFAVRIVVYFAIWTLLARWLYSASLKSDQTGDPEINKTLTKRAAIGIMLFALTVTGGAFDLLMSLDHHWYSTIFGVYFFAGAVISALASCIVIVNVLQRGGFLTRSVTTEHLHDLGKLMFAFTFFWGYVAFSQFMLQWYASIPETTPWWARRGANLSSEEINGSVPDGQYGAISLVLLFGHLLIPFAFLLSRHIKRSRELLLLGAGWMLVMCWLDIYWLVMPELDNGKFFLGLPEIGAALGLIGIFVAVVTRMLSNHPLRPLKDPRLPEALAFHNI